MDVYAVESFHSELGLIVSTSETSLLLSQHFERLNGQVWDSAADSFYLHVFTDCNNEAVVFGIHPPV